MALEGGRGHSPSQRLCPTTHPPPPLPLEQKWQQSAMAIFGRFVEFCPLEMHFALSLPSAPPQKKTFLVPPVHCKGQGRCSGGIKGGYEEHFTPAVKGSAPLCPPIQNKTCKISHLLQIFGFCPLKNAFCLPDLVPPPKKKKNISGAATRWDVLRKGEGCLE